MKLNRNDGDSCGIYMAITWSPNDGFDISYDDDDFVYMARFVPL